MSIPSPAEMVILPTLNPHSHISKEIPQHGITNNRDLKIRRRQRQRECPNSERFNKPNNSTHVAQFFFTLLYRHPPRQARLASVFKRKKFHLFFRTNSARTCSCLDRVNRAEVFIWRKDSPARRVTLNVFRNSNPGEFAYIRQS